MSLNLDMTFMNTEGHEEHVIIETDKTMLISASTYFSSLFSNKFKDSKENNININLTNLEYQYNVVHIKKIFEIELDLNYSYMPPKSSQHVQILMDNNLGENLNSSYKINLDLGFGLDISIYDLYMLESIVRFFNFEKTRDMITKCLIRYKNLFDIYIGDGDCDETETVEHYDYGHIYESYILYYKHIINLQSDVLHNEITRLKEVVFVNTFLNNIYPIYLVYFNTGMTNKFDSINNTISSLFEKYNSTKYITTYLNCFDMQFDEITIDMNTLKQMPLDCCYELVKYGKNIITTETNIFKVYDFYDILNYEKSKWQVFKVNSNEIYNESVVGTKCLKDKDFVIKQFNEKTKHIFTEIDWNSMILSGGFIFGLINNLNNSLLDGSDLDLFLYGTETEINAKMEYLVQYFSKYNPYFITRGRVITVIMHQIPFDIQIIPSKASDPFGIISMFDFSYIKLYYDGNDIYTILDGLVCLKYGVTIFTAQTKDNSIIDTRLYKTIKKGLHIKYGLDIVNKHITNNEINFLQLCADLTDDDKISLNKSVTVRKIMDYVGNQELELIIKKLYKSNNIGRTCDIKKLSNENNDAGYEFLESNKLNKIIELVKDPADQFLIRFKIGDKIEKYIFMKFDFCKFKIYNNTQYNVGKINLILNLIDNDIKLLDELKNNIMKLIKDHKYTDIKQLRRLNKIHILHEHEHDIEDGEEYVPELTLNVHINMKDTQKNNKIKKIVNSIHPSRDMISVICRGKLWSSPNAGIRLGIKFTVCDIKTKPFAAIKEDNKGCFYNDLHDDLIMDTNEEYHL